jgi:hypothetical protein
MCRLSRKPQPGNLRTSPGLHRDCFSLPYLNSDLSTQSKWITWGRKHSKAMKCRVCKIYVILLIMFGILFTQVQCLEHFYSQIVKTRSLHSLVYMVTSLEVGREEFCLDSGPGLLHSDQIAAVTHFAFRRMGIVLRGRSFKVVTYPYLEPRLRMRGVTLHSNLRIHGVVLADRSI